MNKGDVPALAVGIVERGKVTFTGGFGVLDRNTKQPVTQETIFQIGSQSKVLTSIIALELINDGKLHFSDRLVDLLPDVFPKERIADFKKLTIQHLLLHRSGLPDYPFNVSRIDGDAFLGGYSEEMLLSALKKVSLEFLPNEKFSYANFNYAVLGYILSKVTEKNYAQLVKHYLITKYGLSDTFVNLVDKKKNLKMAIPYRKDDRQVETQPWDMGFLTPHGGVFSNIQDLTNLMEQQIEAYLEFYDNGAASPLVSTQIKNRIEKYGDGLSYGLAMFEESPELGRFTDSVLWHGGDLDGFACEYLFSPEKGVGVVILTSSGGRDFNSLGIEIMKVLLENTDNNLMPKTAKVPSD